MHSVQAAQRLHAGSEKHGHLVGDPETRASQSSDIRGDSLALERRTRNRSFCGRRHRAERTHHPEVLDRVQPPPAAPRPRTLRRDTTMRALERRHGLPLRRCSWGGGCTPCPTSGRSPGSGPRTRPAGARSPAALTPGCVQGASERTPSRRAARCPCRALGGRLRFLSPEAVGSRHVPIVSSRKLIGHEVT
jgi:hypothetical protein